MLEHCKKLTLLDIKNDNEIVVDWKIKLVNLLMANFGWIVLMWLLWIYSCLINYN